MRMHTATPLYMYSFTWTPHAHAVEMKRHKVPRQAVPIPETPWWCHLQMEEIRAAVDEYGTVGIWEVQEGPSGDPVVTFFDHCLPY